MASRRLNRVNEAVEALQAVGIAAEGTTCDVTNLADVKALADFAWNEFSHVDVIVNNAGAGSEQKPVMEKTREEVMKALNVNLFGAWNGVTLFGKRMIEQATLCAIYNVGSENSFFNAVPLGSDYVPANTPSTP